MRALASSLGVEQSVRVTGQLSDEEVSSAFRQSDAFAMPSENESFGIVLLEAAVSGLPIVSTPVGVAPELVKPGSNGFLAESCDAEFAGKVIEVLRDGALKDGARKMAPALLDKYSWNSIAASHEALYRRLLDESGRVALSPPQRPAPRAAQDVTQLRWQDLGPRLTETKRKGGSFR